MKSRQKDTKFKVVWRKIVYVLQVFAYWDQVTPPSSEGLYKEKGRSARNFPWFSLNYPINYKIIKEKYHP